MFVKCFQFCIKEKKRKKGIRYQMLYWQKQYFREYFVQGEKNRYSCTGLKKKILA